VILEHVTLREREEAMFDFWTGSDELPIYGFLIRALIVYIYMFIILKVLGQRSIGTITPLDFLFGVIIGDVLGEPLSTGNAPMGGPLAAAALISGLHLFFSYVALKTPRFRRIIEDEPIIIIEKGRILHNELKKTKITVESLMQDLRLRDASDLTEVDYAILESSGQISVIKKSSSSPVTTQDLNHVSPPPKGYPSVLVQDGQIIHANVKKFGTIQWLQEQLHKKGINDAKEVFLLTIDESGKIYYSRK
jgi:uncharacterized membrane protein YcaP (DUF421 family)